jgi:hypothetical protein
MNLFYIVYQVVPRDPPSSWVDLEQQLVFISRTKAEHYIKKHQGIFLLQEMWAQRWIEGKPSPVKFREAKSWRKKKMALPLSLQTRIMRTITRFAADHKMKEEVVEKILKDINEDQILSELGLDTSATVRAMIDYHSEDKQDLRYADLLLYVGPRDFQWRMRDGELVGAGTRVEGGIIDEDCSRRS